MYDIPPLVLISPLESPSSLKCEKGRRFEGKGLVQHLSWKKHLGITKANVGVFEERHFKQKVGIGNRSKCNNGRTDSVFELK